MLDATLCDKVCQLRAAGRWFSGGTPIDKTERHDITEILLKIALNTKRKSTERQILVDKTLHRKLKFEQLEPH